MSASRNPESNPETDILYPDGRHWLIWDGECGFCRRAVEWFARRDRRGLFRIVPFQECPTPPMTPRLRKQSQRAIQVITRQGKQRSAGRAVLFALQEIGWHPRLARLAQRPPFIWLVELAYWIVARNRPFFSRLVLRSNRSGCVTCGR
jgi:predicted DCC family thiol-disulfide oxidoreductase YuxK